MYGNAMIVHNKLCWDVVYRTNKYELLHFHCVWVVFCGIWGHYKAIPLSSRSLLCSPYIIPWRGNILLEMWFIRRPICLLSHRCYCVLGVSLEQARSLKWNGKHMCQGAVQVVFCCVNDFAHCTNVQYTLCKL